MSCEPNLFDTTPPIEKNADICGTPTLVNEKQTYDSNFLNTTPPIESNADFCDTPTSICTSNDIENIDSENTSNNTEGDISKLADLRNSNLSNPLICYLNINSLRGHKLNHVRELCRQIDIDIFCIDETKLTYDFPDAQLSIEGYQFPPLRRDRNDKIFTRGGGKIVYIKEGLIVKPLKNFDTPNAETICLELTISNRKWFFIFAYRPESIDRDIFFDELKLSLSEAVTHYDYIVLAGDLNIDMHIPEHDIRGSLSDICDTFGLSNIINKKTCTKKDSGSSLDVFLSNHPRCFKNTCVIETGFSDYHLLIGTFLKASFHKIPPKNIVYRDYRNFDENLFLEDVRKMPHNDLLLSVSPYDLLTERFKQICDRHAPIKQKRVRGNHAPFMTKELSKAIMTRSRLRNKWNKWKSRENFILYQAAKKHCTLLNKIAKNDYFKNATKNGVMTNREFWKVFKPLLTNKGFLSSNTIILEEDGKLVSDEKELVEIFNNHYVNIVQNATGVQPKVMGDPSNPEKDEETVNHILEAFKDNPIIIKIKENVEGKGLNFKLPLATKEEIKFHY